MQATDRDPVLDQGSGVYTEMYLYDLEHDPYELHNLIHSRVHQGVCLALGEKLVKLMKEAGEGEAVILPQEKEKIGQLAVFDGEELL